MKVIAQAPTRISLFGGGTDLPVFSDKYGGMVISMAINLRQHIILDDENLEWTIPFGAKKDFYMPFLEKYDIDPDKIGITSKFDSVIESGLGSSASAAVALLAAIKNYKGQTLIHSNELVEEAWDIEVNKLGLYGGKQDQCAAVYGGMNMFWFRPKLSIWPELISYIKYDSFDTFGIYGHTLLFYVGENRKNPKIQYELKSLNSKKIFALKKIKKLALEASSHIRMGDRDTIGELLNETWEFKKKSNSKVSTRKIDLIYDTAIKSGAWGGKLCGSGGGGHMVFMASSKDHEKIIENLEKIEGVKNIDYSIDWNGVETRVIK